MMQFNIVAHNTETQARRHFLVESVDEQIARALFIADNFGWEIDKSRKAVCFVGGKHEGVLSVWVGKDDRTAILCQHHGENPPYPS